MESYKILVPTDFTVRSLLPVKKAIEQLPYATLSVFLLHGIYLPTSITDMLYFSKHRVIRELQEPEFEDACALLKSKYYSRIHTMVADVIVSNSNSHFSHYLEANAINELFIPENLQLNFSRGSSFDILPLMKRARIKSTTISFDPQNSKYTDPAKIADLFFL